MASLGNLLVSLSANTAGLRAGLISAEKQITGFTRRTSGALAGLGRGFGLLGVAATGAFAAFAVGAVVTKAIAQFTAFEDAALDLEKVLGETEGTVSDYRNNIAELSKQFAVSSVDVLKGAANFKQAGFAVQEAFELQAQALKLTRISELGVDEASGLLISTLKGFDAQARETTRLIDGMNEVSNKYATSLGQLATGMSQLAPIAKVMGFSFEETAGILTPIIEVFRSGSEAANAMKLVLIRLTSNNKQVRDGLEKLGVSQTHFNGRMKSGKKILNDVQKAFGNLAQEQKIVIAGTLAGARQAARATVIFDGLAKTTAVTADAMNSQGSAQREFEKRMEALRVKIDNTKVAVQELGIAFGERLVPVVEEASEIVTFWSEVLEEKALPIIDKVIAAYGKALELQGQLIKGSAVGIGSLISDRTAEQAVLSEAAIKSLMKNIEEVTGHAIYIPVDTTDIVLLNKLLDFTIEKKASIQAEERLKFGLPEFDVPRGAMDLAQGAATGGSDLATLIQRLDFDPRMDAAIKAGKKRTDLLKEFEAVSDKTFNRMAFTGMAAFQDLSMTGAIEINEMKNIWDNFKNSTLKSGDGDDAVLALFNADRLTGVTKAAFEVMERQFGDTITAMKKEALRLENLFGDPAKKAERDIEKILTLDKIPGAFSSPDVAPDLIANIKKSLPDQQEADALRESLMRPLEVYEAGVKKLQDNPLIDAETEARAMAQLEVNYQKGLKNMSNATVTWNGVVNQSLELLGDSMGDLMFAAWEGDMEAFTDKFRSFVKSLNKMIFDALGQHLTSTFIAPFIQSVIGGGQTGAAASAAGASGGGGGGGGGGILGFLGLHSGGIITTSMHDGGIVGLEKDERLIKAQTGEGFLDRGDMKRIGGAAGFENLRSGRGQGGGDTTINVPVNVEGGNNELAGELQRSIEQAVIKTIREYA